MPVDDVTLFAKKEKELETQMQDIRKYIQNKEWNLV